MVNGYYSNEDVRQRMVEYLGGASLAAATCVYLTRCDVYDFTHPDLKRPADLGYFLEQDLDVGRSLWDRHSLLAHLDIEYVNFDFPAEPYLDPLRTFTLQEPVIAGIKEILAGYGISPLHLISGRGHHFVWRIPQQSKAFALLAELEHAFPCGTKNPKDFSPELGERVAEACTRAFAGLGFILEFIAQQVKGRVAARSPLPVELTAVEAGPGERGREMISIDISEYGDPLHTRMIRLPFSIYLKPWIKDIGPEPLRAKIPRMLMIPGNGLSSREIVAAMQDPEAAGELAKRTRTRIPSAAKAMERAIAAYRRSRLREFHRWFYSHDHEPHERWPETYDLTPLEVLPPCVSRILRQPNDLLLIPAYIQLLVRSLLALGWHPRHIAGLIRSKYERDYGWGHYWLTYDAATRADFYTRIFTATFVTGNDDLLDFNCLSTQEKKLCPTPHQHCALDLFKVSLLARREHEQLACRPFNRLFLPQKPL